MKRVIPVLLGLFVAANLCMAQDSTTRLRRIMAIQELRADGMSAAHNDLPIGSKVKVTNPANGLEIEVTIIAEIPETGRQLIDLSPAAARALAIGSGGPVLVMPLRQLRQGSSTIEETDNAEPHILTEVEIDKSADKEPYNITINNYIIHPQSPLQSNDAVDKLPHGNNPLGQELDNSAISKYNEPLGPELAALPPPKSDREIQAEKVTVFSSPPVHDVQIIPGLPNPNIDKKYRLLVGTFSGVDSAFLTYLRLQAAGFDVAQEQAGNICKVFVDSIPASMVYYATQRLGAIGFQQVWVQD